VVDSAVATEIKTAHEPSSSERFFLIPTVQDSNWVCRFNLSGYSLAEPVVEANSASSLSP
jgi:hypothetical protein